MRLKYAVCLLGLTCFSLFLVCGCSDDGGGGVGVSIKVEVSPRSATVGIGGTLQISADVTGDGSSGVKWYVDGLLGGNATVGTVTQTNPTTFSAPSALPDPATVVVKAVSQADTTRFDTCVITLTMDIVVDVSPPSATVAASAAFSITADVTGGTTNAVEWYVDDVVSGNVIVGTVTQTNPTVYTAPHDIPSPPTVVVKAVSTENPDRFGICAITITEPTAISIEVSPEHRIVDVSGSFTVSADVSGGVTNEVQWYVNATLGGDATLGTITQTNPAVYTAPDEVPAPDSVRVIAVSQEDVSRSDTCTVRIVLSVIHVDASMGDDLTGTGTAGNPVKSIKRGLAIAENGDTVMAAPGIYDEANGEVFPIYLANRVLVGEDWETCILRGSTENGTCVGVQGTGTVFRKFTLEEGPPVGDGWQHAVYIGSGASGVTVDSIRCLERTRYSVIRVERAVDVTVQNCLLDVRAISEVDRGFNRGFEIIFDDEGTILRNCTVKGYHNGGDGTAIFFNGSSNALVEGCTVEDNGTGFYLCCCLSETSNPVPDLGGGARGSTGGNTIRNNDTCGLRSCSANDVYAKYNTWTNDPPIEGVDYCKADAGDIIVE